MDPNEERKGYDFTNREEQFRREPDEDNQDIPLPQRHDFNKKNPRPREASKSSPGQRKDSNQGKTQQAKTSPSSHGDEIDVQETALPFEQQSQFEETEEADTGNPMRTGSPGEDVWESEIHGHVAPAPKLGEESDFSSPYAEELDEDDEALQYSVADQQLGQDIREAIDKEGSLSTASRNIRITVENGLVTLEGTVANEQEKMTAGDKASAFAGFGRVNNELKVQGK